MIDRSNLPYSYDLDRLEAIAVNNQPPEKLAQIDCEASDYFLRNFVLPHPVVKLSIKSNYYLLMEIRLN